MINFHHKLISGRLFRFTDVINGSVTNTLIFSVIISEKLLQCNTI